MWSWDITALKGPVKGIWFKCYVILDIFSRYVTGWLIAAVEDAVVAKDFLDDAINRNGHRPHTIHADRGGAMVSKPVSELLVEAQFKTLKYMPDFPDRFGSLEDTRAFCGRFFTAHNHEHRHSGIGMHTPRLGALRHRRADPSPAAGHPQPRLRPAPRTLHAPTPTTQTARGRLDQPTRQPATTNLVNTTCLI